MLVFGEPGLLGEPGLFGELGVPGDPIILKASIICTNH